MGDPGEGLACGGVESVGEVGGVVLKVAEVIEVEFAAGEGEPGEARLTLQRHAGQALWNGRPHMFDELKDVGPGGGGAEGGGAVVVPEDRAEVLVVVEVPGPGDKLRVGRGEVQVGIPEDVMGDPPESDGVVPRRRPEVFRAGGHDITQGVQSGFELRLKCGGHTRGFWSTRQMNRKSLTRESFNRN